MAYGRITSAFYAQAWALQPEYLESVAGFIELKFSGADVSEEIIAAFAQKSEMQAARAASSSAAGAQGSVAVIPVFGIIAQRSNMVGNVSAARGTSLEGVRQQFRQALNDPSVKAIVLDVDSPGGTVAGCEELFSEIFQARGKKPIVAVADGLMASAAYYLGCAADEIAASPSSMVGSIGVYAALRDESAALEKAGIKVTLVTHGENKAEGDPRTPTTEAAVANMQKMVTAAGQMFDRAVAKGRGITTSDVRKNFGQGAVFHAAEAKSIGLVDRVATLDQVLAGFGVTVGSPQVKMTARSEGMQAAVPTPRADDAGCDCECEPCSGGDCSGCTVDDCDSAGCSCDAASAKAKQRAATSRASQKRKVAIAAV